MTERPGEPAPDGDLELIRRWLGGDERAASNLVERHAIALGRFVGAQGGGDDTEEIVQDAFVRAFQSMEGFRGASSFRTWLFAIARRLILDRRRDARRERGLVELTESDAVTEFDSLDTMVAGETGARIQQALARLTATQREVFTLRVGEGLSYREIAAVAETTEGAARVHYYNALRIIKEYLDA
jgi:RNA polymerase sigma-70 factor, ECF subfamily